MKESSELTLRNAEAVDLKYEKAEAATSTGCLKMVKKNVSGCMTFLTCHKNQALRINSYK